MRVRTGLRAGVLGAGALLGFAVTACSEAAGPDALRLAWVPKALNNPVFETGRDGARLRAAELNRAQNGVRVEVVYDGPLEPNATDQAEVIDRVLAEGLDGLAVSCNDNQECGAAIGRAVDAGVPTMTWDSDSASSKRFTYLGISNDEGGRVAARLLAALLPETGQIAVLSGVQGAANLEARRMGFESELANYPGLSVVATVYGNDSIEQSVREVETTMAAFPNLDGWFFVGLWPLLAEPTSMPQWRARSLAGQLKTVSFDTLEVQLERMSAGLVHGLVGQKYWAWGYDAVDILYNRIVNGAVNAAFTDTGIDVVCLNNLSEMQAMWAANDFTQTLSPCSLLP